MSLIQPRIETPFGTIVTTSRVLNGGREVFDIDLEDGETRISLAQGYNKVSAYHYTAGMLTGIAFLNRAKAEVLREAADGWSAYTDATDHEGYPMFAEEWLRARADEIDSKEGHETQEG